MDGDGEGLDGARMRRLMVGPCGEEMERMIPCPQFEHHLGV